MIKKICIIFTLLFTFISPHFLEAATSSNVSIKTNPIFNTKNLIHLPVELSETELKSIEGKYWPLVVRFGHGAFMGGLGYTSTYWSTRSTGRSSSWRWSGLGTSMLGGGVSNLFLNPYLSSTLGVGLGSFISSWSWGW